MAAYTRTPGIRTNRQSSLAWNVPNLTQSAHSWQGFRDDRGHPQKEEQGIAGHQLRLDVGTWTRLLEGLPTCIGVPKSDGSWSNFMCQEDAPFVHRPHSQAVSDAVVCGRAGVHRNAHRGSEGGNNRNRVTTSTHNRSRRGIRESAV